MDGSLNEPGKTYQFAAIGGTSDYGMLPSRPSQQLRSIEERIGKIWKSADAETKRQLRGYTGTLSRLSSFLLCTRNMAGHCSRFTSSTVRIDKFEKKLEPGMSVALAGHDVCTDFESLLFHGRAVLDKLTWTISAKHSQKCSQFSKLANVLTDITKDKRASRLLGLIKNATEISGTLVDIGGKTALRSRVAHLESTVVNAHHMFMLHRLEDGRILVFDCESMGYPVLGTSHRLALAIPYVVQNALAIYLGCRQAPRDVFTPSWAIPVVTYSDYIREDGNGRDFTVIRADPEAFHLETMNLDVSVMDRAIEPLT